MFSWPPSYILATIWTKVSNLVSLDDNTFPHWFSGQFLCNLAHLSLFFLFYWHYFWWDFGKRLTDELKGQMHLPVSKVFLRAHCTPHCDLPSFQLMALWKSPFFNLSNLCYLWHSHRLNGRNGNKWCSLKTRSLLSYLSHVDRSLVHPLN